MSDMSNAGVEKPMREVSVEGCELLGKGGNGAVYRLDDETIVKVYFSERSDLEKIKRNREITRSAFIQGVPSMIAFDMVRVGDNYGVVYENIHARSMSQEFVAHPEKTDEYAHLIAKTLLKLHHTEFEKGVLPDSKERYRNEVKITQERGFYKPEEAERLYKLVDNIPDRNTFIHQDFHPGNQMYQDGEILLIDVDDSGLGHPILDLAAMHMVYVTAAKSSWKNTSLGVGKQQFARIWQIILSDYFNTNDPAELSRIDKIIEGYAMINLIKGVATSPSVPNFIRKPYILITKRKLFSMVDSLHPIP